MPTSSPRQISDEPESPTTRKTLSADSPLHPVSLLAGAGSAAIAAVIGGQLGLSGTVIGAAVGSLVAAVTATTIRASVHRSRAAALALANRRRTGVGAVPIDTVAVQNADPATTRAPWSGWVRGAVTVGAGFALGIAGLLLLQLGLGRNLSPGTDQLQSVAARVVVASPTAVTARPSPTATMTVTETAPAAPSLSPSSSQSAGPVTFPTVTQLPSASSTPSAAPTPNALASS
jgi:hypothetical protein